MVLQIETILYYGRYYPFIENEYGFYWWFSNIDFTIYSVDELLGRMGFYTYQDICDSDVFFPLFKTDIVQTEKNFLSERSLLKEFGMYIGGFPDEDAAFKSFIEKLGLQNQWFEYERYILRNDAVAWCKKHNIVFDMAT